MTHCQAECPYRLTDSVRGLNVSGVVVVSGSGPGGGQLYGGRSWSDNSRDTQKGFGYYVNRDRCVLKDGVYWGEGNRELQPHGHMMQVWAENAQNVTVDCGGRSMGKNIFSADKHGGEHVTVVGSVSVHGVVMRRCNVRVRPAPYRALCVYTVPLLTSSPLVSPLTSDCLSILCLTSKLT